MSNLKNRRTVVFTTVLALLMSMTVVACGDKKSDVSPVDDIDYSVDEDALNTDIDLDAIKKSADAIKDLNLNVDLNNTAGSEEATEEATEEGDKSVTEPKGEKTVYSYADVYQDGNNLAVIPNGGLNSSTVLLGDKDLNGFLDYVDSKVLEPGRKINRDFFYDLMSVMLVDKDLSANEDYIEKHMMAALAVANNFHDTPVKINECDLDANNATDYVCKVTAYDKDDVWIFNFAQDSLYMNNGATEYVSDMFKNEYMAVWLMAMDEYFELNL